MRVFSIGTAPNVAGGSAGATVTINVSKLSGDGVTPGLPANYYVHMTPNQPKRVRLDIKQDQHRLHDHADSPEHLPDHRGHGRLYRRRWRHADRLII
jgi:hypothetical protein